MNSKKKVHKKDGSPKRTISLKIRYMVLWRDNSTCQKCRKTVKDGIKLEVYHRTHSKFCTINNLWSVCNECTERDLAEFIFWKYYFKKNINIYF